MVVAFVIAAVLTPPDVLSQMALAVPLLLLYEGSIIAVKIVERRAKADAEAKAQAVGTAVAEAVKSGPDSAA